MFAEAPELSTEDISMQQKIVKQWCASFTWIVGFSWQCLHTIEVWIQSLVHVLELVSVHEHDTRGDSGSFYVHQLLQLHTYVWATWFMTNYHSNTRPSAKETCAEQNIAIATCQVFGQTLSFSPTCWFPRCSTNQSPGKHGRSSLPEDVVKF